MTSQRIVGVGNLNREKVGLGVPLQRWTLRSPVVFDIASATAHGDDREIRGHIATEFLNVPNRVIRVRYSGGFDTTGVGGEIWTIRLELDDDASNPQSNVAAMTDSAVTDVWGGEAVITLPTRGSRAAGVSISASSFDTSGPATTLGSGYPTAFNLTESVNPSINLHCFHNGLGTPSTLRVDNFEFSLWGQS